MDRQAFLARIRDAARKGSAHRVRTKNLPADAGYVGAGNEPVTRLAAEINAVGGRACLADDAATASRQVGEFVKDKRPRTALCWEHPLLERLGLRDLLRAQKIEWLSLSQLAAFSEEERRARMLSADLGIASADFAIAETGTLAIASGPGRERCVTLLPPVLLQIVDASQIIPDLFDFFRQTENAVPASNVTLITGPSKTGDIELQLTTGVHGPSEWHVIIVRQARRDLPS